MPRGARTVRGPLFGWTAVMCRSYGAVSSWGVYRAKPQRSHALDRVQLALDRKNATEKPKTVASPTPIPPSRNASGNEVVGQHARIAPAANAWMNAAGSGGIRRARVPIAAAIAEASATTTHRR